MNMESLAIIHRLNALDNDSLEYMNHRYVLEDLIKRAKKAYEGLSTEERAVGLVGDVHDRFGEDIVKLANGDEPEAVNDAPTFLCEILDGVGAVVDR